MLHRLNHLPCLFHHKELSPTFAHGFGDPFNYLLAHRIAWLTHYGYDPIIYYSNTNFLPHTSDFGELVTGRLQTHQVYEPERTTRIKTISSIEEFERGIFAHLLPADDIPLLENLLAHCDIEHSEWERTKPVFFVHNIETIQPLLIEKLMKYGRVIVSGDCSQLANHTTLRQRGSYMLCENLSGRDLQVPTTLKRGQGIFWTYTSNELMYVLNDVEHYYYLYNSILRQLLRLTLQEQGCTNGPQQQRDQIRNEVFSNVVTLDHFYTINKTQEYALDLRDKVNQALMNNGIKGVALILKEDEILRIFMHNFCTMIRNYTECKGEFDPTLLQMYCADKSCIIQTRYINKLLEYQQLKL